MNGTAAATSAPPPVSCASDAVRKVALSLAFLAQHKPGDVDSFFQLCITLSSGLDYAIANKQVPAHVSELPTIFKLVCQRRNEFSLQAPIMVLMVTVKSSAEYLCFETASVLCKVQSSFFLYMNACKAHWFSSQESKELLDLADEMVSFFCTPEGFSCEQANIIPTVSKIMSRYYPQIKLGHLLASVAIKPGFEACALDFHIPKTVTHSATEKIRLLVAVKDNIDTSSCIINPSKVNILLNGLGLEGRIMDSMYHGPQLPTVVNPMLRYGTNLLQAIGHFDAHYIVLIAYMSAVLPSDLPAPYDYHQPPAAAMDSAEVVEGPSKISLNCPISFKRIRQPVKGHLCKHLQCFDLSNYTEINFKRPSWKCPHCNQPVCFPDIRIDKKMVKILEEVGKDATSVLIHSDGSWEAHQNEVQLEATGMETDPSNVYDLTESNDVIISSYADVPKDRKATVKPEPHCNSVNMNLSTSPAAQDSYQAIQNSVNQVEGLPCLGNTQHQAGYNTRVNVEANCVLPPAPISGHYVHPTPNQEQQAFLGSNRQSTSPSLNPPPLSDLWQQLQLDQMMRSVGYAIPGNVSRTPIPNSLMYSRPPVMNTAPRNSSSLPRQTFYPPPSTRAASTSMDSHQQLYASIQQSMLQQSLSSQMRGYSNSFRGIPPGHEAPHQPNTMQQQQQRMQHINHRATCQAPTMQWSEAMIGRPIQAPISTFPLIQQQQQQQSDGTTVQRVLRTEDLLNMQQQQFDEQIWQPSGRMRGSITGQAYNEARDQLMIRPTAQQTTSPRNQYN